jgi:formate dehydrogenase major subunit
MVGSAQVNNEECYLLAKLARLMGVVFLEHQARLCHSSTVPALTAALGRGAMTNTWNDLKNAKVILIEGSNAAENHPMSTKWIARAQDNGATVIHVDPRFTRTSKIADIHAQIRPGTDIAFLGALINYVLENDLYDKEYVRDHTNAYALVNKSFGFDDGLFSGYNEAAHKYDTSSWSYQTDAAGFPIKTDDLNHPDSVFTRMKEHYKRYTFETTASITGIPADQIERIAKIYASNRPGTVIYALGMTQHTVGVQNIRSFTVLQLLLGNMGKPGTGINALRGEPNVQGSTDFALLFNYLPGYLNYPDHNLPTVESWQNANGSFRAKFLTSLLKAWFGDNATAENDYCYGLLPKKNASQNYSIYRIFETAIAQQMKLLWVSGQNPMVTNPNLNVVHEGLSNLETLIVSELFMTETAAFWERPGTDPASIKTEVIFLPAASFLEKEGTLANSGRLIQWRYTGIGPIGDCKSDLDIADMVFNRLRQLYSTSNAPKDQIFKLANWNYPAEGKPEAVLKEINGRDLNSGKLLNAIGEIKADGSTPCGNWVYAGVFTETGNHTKRRDNRTDPGGLGIFPGYAWTWPGNIHILYNRASANAAGKPFSEDNKLVWWDSSLGRWTGYDSPDVGNALQGPDTPNGQKPFRMNAEGIGRLMAPIYKDFDAMGARDVSSTPADGPFPEFYEPVESPTDNRLHPKVAYNPCLIYPRLEKQQPIGDRTKFPYVLCTSSITEHWCGGAQTRNVPWLNELMKETYIEMPKKLADKLNVKNGDAVKVSSARDGIEVKAMVTDRLHTLDINDEEVYVVWMPYNWGFKGLSTAASTNLLTIDAGDPNTWIQETKACLVNVEKA